MKLLRLYEEREIKKTKNEKIGERIFKIKIGNQRRIERITFSQKNKWKIFELDN